MSRTWLVASSYEFLGAGPMGRLSQQAIKTLLADEVLLGRPKSGGAGQRRHRRERQERASLGNIRPGPVEPGYEALLPGNGEPPRQPRVGKKENLVNTTYASIFMK
jgi:ATP-dependent Clp protease ATP-binding subunit ClpA